MRLDFRFSGIMPLIFIVLFTFKASAEDYLTSDDFENESAPLKMLVFLSEKCPCSKSHILHINELMRNYKQLKVYGVISEPARNAKDQREKDAYFKNENFGFGIIQDPGQNLVRKYKALKTPHVVLLRKNSEVYQVVYQGGLTDSKVYNENSKKFVENALVQIKNSQEVKVKNGFCLGCHIRRF